VAEGLTEVAQDLTEVAQGFSPAAPHFAALKRCATRQAAPTTTGTYSVEAAHALPRAAPVAGQARAAPVPSGTAAVLVVHGMGGQLPFQTLTDIADGLHEASVRVGGTPSESVARAVGVGDDRLQRMELTLSNGTSTRVVHVYEAYWAPITEGEVTLRDVIRFLFKAGLDGLWHSALPFKRFLDKSSTSPGHVENQSDPEACVWLAAHTQYWDGQLVLDTIHRHLVA